MIVLGILASQISASIPPITTSTLAYSFRQIVPGYSGVICTLRSNSVDTDLFTFQEVVDYINNATNTVFWQRYIDQTGNGNDLTGSGVVSLVGGYPEVLVSSMTGGSFNPTGSFVSMVMSDDGSSSVPLWGTTAMFGFACQTSTASTYQQFGTPDLYIGNTPILNQRNVLRLEILNQMKIVNYRNCDFSSWNNFNIGGYPSGFAFNGKIREIIAASSDYENIVNNQKDFYSL